MLVPYHARVRAELERHGGSVEKFIGDAAVAIFGAPDAHEDDPERAVRAALAITDAIAELNASDEWLPPFSEPDRATRLLSHGVRWRRCA